MKGQCQERRLLWTHQGRGREEMWEERVGRGGTACRSSALFLVFYVVQRRWVTEL